jgi:phage shock protein A
VRLEAQRTARVIAPDVSGSFAKFAHFEERLVDMEDHMLAQVELAGPTGQMDAFVDLKMKKRIDEELEMLKAEK